jgi:type II secretory pathway predicted ATPase ExeA
MIDKIRRHYSFEAMPFGRDLPPAALHRHAAHVEAAARITWTISERALGVITGEVGTGKTVAARAAVAGIDPTRHTVIYIANPAAGIHHHIVTSLGGRPRHGTAAIAGQAYDLLAGEAAERGRTPVLIIDEAHLLDHDQLESVRMLTNHDMDSKTPFATVLLGQPTLRRMIKLGVLAALDQRITVRYQMAGMTPGETASYIRHHLQNAGHPGDLFSDEAIAQIHEASRGKPRTVNNLAVSALIAGYAAGKTIIDAAAARAAVSEVITTE